MPDGTFKILVEGIERVKIQSLSESDNYYNVSISTFSTKLPGEEIEKQLLEKVVDEIIEKFEDYNQAQQAVSKEFFNDILSKNDPARIIDAVVHALAVPFNQKQSILETASLLERAKKVLIAIDAQIEVSELESTIHSRVKQQMDKMQRRFYLNEQMKVIREEMDEGEGDEFEQYKEKILKKNLPDEIRTRLEQELKKLETMPAMSAGATVVRNYLDCALELPWSERSEDNDNIVKAEEILEDSHYGLDKVKDRILEFIAVRQLSPASKGPILCLVGPPGVGKTSLARALANCLGRKFSRVALGGIRDEAEIGGHRKTYIGAMPGRIISTLRKSGVKNPVILLDELDKISSDYRGNPAAALLEVLDPEQNQEFTDNYLELPYDLSEVLFLATANVVHSIPGPLLDRLELIELGGYTEQEKIEICRKFLVPKLEKDNGVASLDIECSEEVIACIIRHYTKEAGVRQIERQLAKVMRKIAREYLHSRQTEEKLPVPYRLDVDLVRGYLGPERFNYGKKEEKEAIGKVNGLAWTTAGGDILDVEVALAYGQGKLTVTGNLGDVMKESVNTALGFVKSQAHLLGLASDFFDKTDMFLHVPEGAIPKDGPSAGITIATAIISAVTQAAVRNDIAMTGEITLRGQVLAIGGLKEKVLAAFRGGIYDIVCPEDNRKDLEEIPGYITDNVRFHFVRRIEDVVRIAIRSEASLFQEKPGALPFSGDHIARWNRESNIVQQ